MEKTIRGFFYKMNISRFLLFYLFVAFSVLNIKSVQNEELVEVQSWAGFQGLNVLSVGAVANDCKKIFDSCRADSQKTIDDLNKVVESTQDAAVVPPKLWDALGRITDTLQNAPKNVRFHFSELGDHFLKKLNSTISTAKSKNFDKLQELQSIFDSGVDQTNESVLELEKSFSVNYNPNSILQQAVPESLNQASYSQSVAMYELKHLSTAVNEEIDNIEKAALKLLNRIYRGITLTKEVSFSVKKSSTYPTKYDEPYILNNLRSCTFLAKALKPDASNNNPVSQPVSTTPPDSDSDADPVIPSLSDETPGGDESGCGELFRKSEKKIMQQLIITIKEIRPIDDRKEIDSRMFQVFKNYSLVLSNLNKKVITNVITVVNQFFQLYNIVLSILDKINPDMKSKAEDLLYLQDIDTTDTNYENINKYIVEDYLSSSKMNELLQRIDNHVKSMKSLSEVKKGIIQELSVITNDIGIDLQTMKSTIINVLEEIKKGVKALQNLKNKSNRTGFRYYLNFYRGKADLAQLRKLICIINSLKIELLLERQLFTDDEELEAFKAATADIQNEINEKNQKLLTQLNTMNDFNFVQGFVSKSVLDYNMCLETYTVQSRTILKKVITKYVTIFEELIIIIKRRKIKNAKTIEDLYSNDSSSSNQDETVSKYLLEKTDIDIEKLCSTLNQETIIQNKETVTQEISELTTVTHSEVTKINETVLKYINLMSSEIHNLKAIRDEASQTVDYEISDEKLKCISSIIHIIDSLHIKSNKDEIQSLSIYFERVKEKIQMATQNFETQTSECVEMQQFRTQVETLKTSIFEALTKASFEINDRIRRVIFEYNEKMYMLQQNSSYCELNSLQSQESSFTLNDNTRKYVTGYYNSEEIFTSLDTIMNSASSSDISQVKTDMYAKLDETNEGIESELEKIHDDLNKFVEKFSQGLQVVTDLETRSQKQSDQSDTIDQTDFATLQEVDGMVKVIGKYVNVNAENSQRELKVQIDNARLQISNKFEQVSETLTSTQDHAQMESIMVESINSCETIYNDLKNNTRSELTRSVEEFLSSYQKTITTLHSQVSTSQTTILQDLNKGDCKTENNDYEKFMQMMLQQDYQSSTTVSNTFEYMKKYNFVDSQNLKEKCSQLFQSLSNKMNMEIDNISHISKYVLENVQKANNVLIKLENCENKQNITLSLTDEELQEFRVARSVNKFWQYTIQDTTISSIGTTIINARSQIDLEYKKIQTKLESSSDQNIVQSEIQTCLQNIQNIFETTQSQVNEIVKQNVESFYTSMTTEINEFQSSGSSTLNTALQSVINDRSVSSTNQQQNLSKNVDFNSFSSSVNIQQMYNEIKTKTTQNSSQTIENFKQVINEKFSKVEKTSAYIVENVQKGYSVIEEIKTSLQLDSNYQLTQYQEEQLRKCVSVSHKVGNLKVDAKTAQTTITNSISSIKNQISEEFTKINESVSSLTEEKSIQETISKGINKFEELFAQAKSTVKEQLALASSGFYSSYTQTITNIENQNSGQVCKVMRDISSGITSYESSSDQSYMDTVSYFNSKSFKSCLSIKNWFHDIQSTSSMESFSTVSEKSTKELSNLNDKITSSFDKMESSSTFVLNSIQQSTDMLTQIEESVKQDATYQLTEDQIIEFQKCISTYQSIQTVTTTSTVTAQDSIQDSIDDVKSKISSTYSEITQSISSCTDDNSIVEIKTKGVQKFEQIFSQAKESVKEELFQSLNSFYNSFSQISTDSHAEFNQISTTLQNIKSTSNTYQSEEKTYQETISYFNSESFKSCVTIKNWFNEMSSSTSSTSSSNMKEKTINEFNIVNEKITSSLEKLETSSTFILQTIESSTQIFKQIETSMIQGSTYQLNQEQTTQLQKCMNVYQSVQKTVISTSTLITQQTIQSDVTNTKEEINNAYTQITQSISSAADDNSVRQVETVGVDNYENIFSQATQSIKEQLFQKSSDFYSMFTQLSTDMKQENLQTVVSSENISQSENDQSFTNTLSCFNNEMFTSTSVIKSWYSEIKKTTSESDWSILSGGLSGKVKSDFSTLNEKVTKSIDSIQESSTQVLDTIKKGFETIKLVKESMIQDSSYKMTQEQVTFLQKCVTVHQTIEIAMTTTSITETTKAKKTVESDITSAKSLITEEFKKATETIKSLTEESSINEAATKSISNMDQFFSQTKGKVETVLSDSSNNFYNTFQKVSSLCEKQGNSQIKQVLSDITNNKSSYQSQNDQCFSGIISYFNDSNYKSSSTIQNWYNELKSSSVTTASSNISESTINKLSTLNEKVIKSIDSIHQTSSNVIDTIEKGSEVLKEIEESTTKNSNYQLSQDQVSYLQKCVTIYQTIQTVTTTTTTTSSTTTAAKQTITSDIQNVKSKITDEFNKATETIKSLTDEKSIQEAATKSVSNMDQLFSETKGKVQTTLSDSSSNFYSTYQKVTSMCEKQENMKQVLTDITNNKSSYQSQNDKSFSSIISYFNDSSYQSSSTIQNWYNEMKSSSTTTASSNISESTINQLNTLNERVTKSIDTVQQTSSTVLDTFEKGSEVLKQIEESTTKNSNYQLSQDQVTYLQKCITIYQTIQTVTTTTTTSTTTSTAKQTITSDIKNVKSKITDEFAKVSESLKTLTDESSIKQVVKENVDKVDQCYSETKQKVHTELNQASSDFFNNYQQISSNLDKQDVSILQDIVSGKNTYQSNSDETYSKMVSYLSSDTYKTNTSVQNWYNDIHSSTSSTTNQSSTSEYAINELSTLNNRVTKSIDSMEECSNYVLNSIDKGSEVIKQIQQSTKENTNYHLTETQITELKKTISIYQIIQSTTISSKSTSTTTLNAQRTITSEVGNAKTQINQECTKVAETIRSLSDETSIKKAVDDNVCKVEQYYGQVKDKVQTQLNETSCNFFNDLQTFSTTLNTQSKSETSTMIQDILESKSTYNMESDQSFNNVVTYLNSDSFKSNKVVQNLYQNIQSDTSTSTSTNYNEQAINHLNTFNNHVSKSVDSMEENSKYILDTMKQGSEVIQQIQESTKQDSNYKITQDQVIILKKCITIYQTIKTVITTTTTTTTSTTSVSNNEKSNKADENNVNQARDISQESMASSVGKSIANVFGMGSESEKTNNLKKEDSTAAKDVNQSADLATNHAATNGEQKSTTAVEINKDDDSYSSTSISNTQQKISTNVSNAKTQINDEFTKTSQSLSSMSDETEIKKAVDENVQKVDKYYADAKKEVQTHLTQTTSSFFNSCQKVSKNLKTQKSQSDSMLQEIINDKTTYQADDDEDFKQVVTYLNSDSFKSSSSVQNWYTEIHSKTSTSDLSKQSVDELNNLNGLVTESVDKMENHSKYILDTMKQGSEILKQIEDSSKQNTKLELTQSQIIVLKKCITIYQIIETVTTTTTTVTNTVSVKNNSVTDHSVASDDEYEYDIQTKKNTKEVVQVEETTQEDKANTTSNIEHKAASNSISDDSVKKEAGGTNSSDTTASINVQSTASSANGKDSISSNSTADGNSVTKKNSKNEVKKASHADKIDRLKKFTQDQSTSSKTSLTTLMVKWTVTKSTKTGVPNTCESLSWDKYLTHDEDDNTIKEISDLLAVGRSVIEDSIELKKEKLPLYRNIDEIESMVGSCTEIVDEILLQLSEVVGQDVQVLKSSFSESLKKNLPDASKILNDKEPTLNDDLLSAASTFFSMKDSKKTDLLNQINRKFPNAQINDEKKARDIATKKFNELQSIMSTVLDNIDCLVLRVVDTIENAKHSMTNLKNDDSYICIKNGQVLCDTVKIPPS